MHLQDSPIKQDILIRILALRESDVREGAGLFSGYKRSAEETVEHFKTLCGDQSTKWRLTELQDFCRTRRLGFHGANGKKLSVSKLLLRILTQLQLEAQKGRPTHIHCPRKSQLASQKRRLALARAGILNEHNCTRLVKVEVPPKLDSRWRYVLPVSLIDSS